MNIFCFCSCMSVNVGNNTNLTLPECEQKSSDDKLKNNISQIIEGIPMDSAENYLDLVPPYQSNIAPFYFNNRVGIRCLIKIDTILGPSNINSKDSTMIRNGMVVKKNMQSPLTQKDVMTIYELYKKWWRKVQNKPFGVIVSSYKKNPPLINTDYTWLLVDKSYFPSN